MEHNGDVAPKSYSKSLLQIIKKFKF